ncbi:MAG: aldehyde dehydrogenase family protein, partial [Wohlfahrtiimonas sp.]
IAVAAAKKGVPSVLELGGKSANIVFADADYEKALRGAQNAIFGSAGQSCVSGSRVLIEKSIFDQFVKDLTQTTNRFVIGNPDDETTQIGPIHNQKQYEHVCNMIKKGLAEGAVIPSNNAESMPNVAGYYVNPTVLVGNNKMACAQEEIFGPVVIAIPFETEAEAISIANDSQFGLAGAVWCKDVAKAHRVASKVKAGTFWINGYKTIHVSSPFGGYDSSGYGRSSGIEALHAYSQVKSIWVERAEQPLVNFGYGAQEE